MNGMGNTGLLSRQTEAYLSRIVQKGVSHEKAVNERQIELQRILTPAEIVEMQVHSLLALPSHVHGRMTGFAHALAHASTRHHGAGYRWSLVLLLWVLSIKVCTARRRASSNSMHVHSDTQ
jgi:hypothetical protein